MSAVEKKRFYNRVRRTCLKHDIDIIYDGVPKMLAGVELLKNGSVIVGDYANDAQPLDVNWKRIHEDLNDLGITGGVK